jgi:hypothetical protein
MNGIDEIGNMDRPDLDSIWYQPNLDVYLNLWFARYEEGRKSLGRDGGFLLPYKKHFFVCEPGVIRTLGLDPDDPDWEKVGWNCVKPLDGEAFKRLRAKRLKVIESN